MIILLSGSYFWISMLVVIILLGFAYIVLAHANKETGPLKKIGMSLSGVIIFSALLVFIYGVVYCGLMMKSWYGKYEKFYFNKGSGMTIDLNCIRDEEIYNIVKQIMTKPGMREWIQEYINQGSGQSK